MKELTEAEVLKKIEDKEAFVLKVFMDNCSFCDQYAPIIEAAADKYKDVQFFSFNLPVKTAGTSEFKRTYMKVESGEKLSAPVTMLFAEGKMKHRHFGLLTADQLEHFLQTGENPETKIKKMRDELVNLYAQKGEIVTIGERLPQINARIGELQQVLQQGARS